jgi:2-polyprenyl-3-methyl-5-hydroxy-6-metoxy-1,4-benzoquinol methylase
LNHAKECANSDLVALLTDYYRREAEALPEWARETYNVLRRVEQNIAALKTRRVFPMLFIAREVELQGARVLDAGCGTGHTAILFAQEGARVVGLDIDRLALDIARLRSQQEGVVVKFLDGDVTRLQFPAETFDVVISHQVLEHLEPMQQVQALQEMWRVLRIGGLLFVQTPNRCFPVDVHDSQLPLAHWLPRNMGRLYARLFGRIPPLVHPMTWADVAIVLKLDRRGSGLINQCDMYHDLVDFLGRGVTYTTDKSWRSRIYFTMVVPLFRICRLISIPYVACAPNLNLLLRKQATFRELG